MIEDSIFSLNFFKYKGVQTGSFCGMRYRMVMAGEGPDVRLDAWVWPEPWCFEVTPEEKKTAASFPYSEEGRQEAVRWIREQYESRREEWEHAPFIL